jgi:2-polyprenyl-3-methyl-5-hydroxy-6-metoxy-1,4-benzoquinol methylase
MGASGVPPPPPNARPLSVRVDTTEIVAAFRKGGLDERTSQNRALKWHRTQATPIEYLVPRIFRTIDARWPTYMDEPRGRSDISPEQLRARVQELSPWMVPFRLGQGVATVDLGSRSGRQNVQNYLFRRNLISDTVADVVGAELATSTVLDIGCNSGFFSLDLATRGAQHVDGVDLRPDNIARAQFVKEHFGVDNVDFRVSDADDLDIGRQWDVVLNLGLLYHVLNPLQLLRRTYELCSRFAIVDTVVHREPVSAFFLVGDKNVDDPTEGREDWELHPTYRATIETIKYAGFAEVIEIVGRGEPAHPLYGDGRRRCFLAIK